MSDPLLEKFEAVARKVRTYCILIDGSVATKRGDSAFLAGMDPEHFIVGQVPSRILGKSDTRGGEKSLYHVITEAGLELIDSRPMGETVMLKNATLRTLTKLEEGLDSEIEELQRNPEYRKKAKEPPKQPRTHLIS